MNSGKSMNSFEMKKDRSPNYLWDNFCGNFFNNFLTLLSCNINVFDTFNILTTGLASILATQKLRDSMQDVHSI